MIIVLKINRIISKENTPHITNDTSENIEVIMDFSCFQDDNLLNMRTAFLNQSIRLNPILENKYLPQFFSLI